MANNKITEEHVKDLYKKFKDYYMSNKEGFFEKTQKHIVDDIKQLIQRDSSLTWNSTSLTDYINNLLYMLKGESFARTINKFSEKYYIDKICEDFDSEFCSNAKKSLQLHKEYYRNIISKGDNTDKATIKIDDSSTLKIKNIILYGAPGVGKTHNYKKLISMIEEGKTQKEIFDSISKNEKLEQNSEIFQTIKDEKRVEFVTFHQSYSYEDFIEGFRPQENNGIKLEDGIFKKLCDDAEVNLLRSTNTKDLLFVDAVKLLLKEKIENQDSVKIDLKRKDSYYKIYDYNEKTIYFEKQNGDQTHTLSLKTLEKMYYEGENNIVSGGLAPYYNPLLEKLLELKNKDSVEPIDQKNFYIVIDEINRGNISKIFGELITLIEEDKRDTYEVTLPYSKEKFKVPSNLYIVATMNSTDKSIATVDIALRRRFTFLKMEPKLELVTYPQAKKLMEELNKHISQKLNDDYKLGHSYFMKVQNDEDLEFVKEYKIKPLLEEYFYADDENYKKAINLLKEVVDE